MPVQEGMWGDGGPGPKGNDCVDELGCYQYFRQICSVNPFCHSTMDRPWRRETYDRPNSDDLLSNHPVMLDGGEWWIFCHTFLLLEVPIPQTMDAFLGWATGVITDLLHWLVGVWGADVKYYYCCTNLRYLIST